MSSTPIVYLGETTGPVWRERLESLGWGRMWIKRVPRDRWADEEPLAIDNGVAADYKAGRDWDGARFADYIARVAEAGIVPDFAVLPDRFGDWLGTLKQSWKWLDRMPEGWPLYFVLQDGAQVQPVEHVAPLIAGIFLGGTKRWQSDNARFWRDWTRERGLPIHWGGTARLGFLRAAYRLGFDSLDTMQPMWASDKWREFVNIYRQETGEQLTFREVAV